MSRPGKRGTTLVELLIAVTLMVLVFGGAMLIWNFSNRSRGVSATARALQTALFIQEQITGDIGRLVQAGESPVRFDPKVPARLSFYAFDTEPPPGQTIPVHAVVYSLSSPPAMLKREWRARVEPLGVSPLNGIRFAPFRGPSGAMLRVSMEVGREPGEPPGPPTVHTFLVRIPRTNLYPTLDIKVVSSFRDPKDKPVKQNLPPP